MEITEKQTKEGTEYIVVESETSRYYFSRKGEGYCPSTIGATDEEGLTKACNHLKEHGYSINVSGMSPAGFEYNG